MSETHDMTSTMVEIVAAYVANNSLPASDLTSLMTSVHRTLMDLSTAGEIKTEPVAELKPAVSIKKSITDDYLISLENGQKFKSLKRHLMTNYGMTPDAYRQKWGLPNDYPMVAPNYAKTRSTLARTMGLGRKPTVPEPVALPASEPKKVATAARRVRTKKAA